MKSFFAKLKLKRNTHPEPLSLSEKINLIWFSIVFVTLLLLIFTFWYAIGVFEYWSNIENKIMVIPPETINYDSEGAAAVLEYYQFMSQELLNIQSLPVTIVSPATDTNGQEVRVGQ